VGRELIRSYDYGGKTYSVCAMTDTEMQFTYLQLICGDINVLYPDLLYTDSLTQAERDSLGLSGDTAAYVQRKINRMNAAILARLGPAEVPPSDDFLATVLFILRKLVFFLDAAGMPQVKLGS